MFQAEVIKALWGTQNPLSDVLTSRKEGCDDSPGLKMTDE